MESPMERPNFNGLLCATWRRMAHEMREQYCGLFHGTSHGKLKLLTVLHTGWPRDAKHLLGCSVEPTMGLAHGMPKHPMGCPMFHGMNNGTSDIFGLSQGVVNGKQHIYCL